MFEKKAKLRKKRVRNEEKQPYVGFHPKEKWEIERISSDVDPKEFFENYVSQRKPGIIFICVYRQWYYHPRSKTRNGKKMTGIFAL
jgi:hypothetical protein